MERKEGRALGVVNLQQRSHTKKIPRLGRPRKTWVEEIHTMPGMNLAELRDAAEDRDLWRRLIMTIARTLRADSTR